MLSRYLDLSSESDSDGDLDLLLLLNQRCRKERRRNSGYLKKRRTHGEFVMTRELCNERFTNYFRLSQAEFEELHNKIRHLIYSEGCNAQKPIGTEEKLAVFLRYLASGDSYKSIGYSYRMGDRTVANIVNEVSVAIWRTLQPDYLPQPTTEKWLSIASDYNSRWNFPHCVGAIDGKHVVIQKPKKSGSSYYNYKHTFSIVLMAAVDAKYKFTFIDVGSMGRFSDGSIFSSCELEKKMIRGTLQLPAPSKLPSYQHSMPYVFVGDEAFPLMVNLMRPYPKKQITNNYQNKVFNYRLSRARQAVECAFGILASRFRVFLKPFEIKVSSVVSVVKAACVIHNYLRRNATVIGDDEDDPIEHLPGLGNEQLLPIVRNRARSVKAAFAVRQKYTTYFNSIGSVPWQEERVSEGQY